MNWKDEFIERFCDVHKPSNPWQPTAYKWTLFKTTETEDVFIFIESLLKKQRVICAKKWYEEVNPNNYFQAILNAPEPGGSE